MYFWMTHLTKTNQHFLFNLVVLFEEILPGLSHSVISSLIPSIDIGIRTKLQCSLFSYLKEIRSSWALVAVAGVCVTVVVREFFLQRSDTNVAGDTLLTLYNIRGALLLLCILIVPKHVGECTEGMCLKGWICRQRFGNALGRKLRYNWTQTSLRLLALFS